jgi:capsid protein
MAVKTIQDEIREHAEKARALIAKARAEERDLSESEQREYDEITKAMSGLSAKRQRGEGFEAMLRSVESMALVSGRPGDGGSAAPLLTPTNAPSFRLPLGGILPFLKGGLNLGSLFIENEAIRSILGQPRSGHWSSPAIEIENVVSITPAGPIPAGTQVVPAPPVYPFDLVAPRLAQGTTDAGSVPYLQETTFTNSADYVAMGAAKPLSDKVFTLASAPVLKIAHIIKVPDELLDDVSGMRSMIDANMAGGVVAKTEKEIINGAGGAGKFQGLITLAGKTPDVAADPAQPFIKAIATAAAKVWTTSKRRPDTVVLSPNTYLAVTMQTNSQGALYIPTAFSPVPQPLYGLVAVQSPEVPDGQAIVGAFGEGGMLFRRGGIVIQATNSDADDFQKNITSIRAEIRLALAWLAPSAFCLVTGVAPLP